jgi:Glycosyl transferase family 2
MQRKSCNPRLLVWASSLAVAGLVCWLWSTLPTLDAAPLFRVGLFFSGGVSMLGLVFFFPSMAERRAHVLIISAAVFLRILLWSAPVSDDVNRYLWEGQLVRDGGNPYSAPASDPRWENRHDAAWMAMNHRERTTAYPPGIQWIMAATTAVSPSLGAFKWLAVAGDLVTLWLLLRLLRFQSLPLRWAGLYAFNPIILISFTAEAHFDSLMTAALLAALLATRTQKWTTWGWLGLAVQIKLVVLVLVPLFLTRRLLPSCWLWVVMLILPSLPFFSGLLELVGGVLRFGNSGVFNGPLVMLTGSAVLGWLVFAGCVVMVYINRWRGLALVDACLWLLGALLVCSPIVHFWYVAWLLPLVALRPSFAWTTLSLTLCGYFLAWWTLREQGWWGFGDGVTAMIWLPWLLAGMMQNRSFFKSSKVAAFPEIGHDLSVVIPVYNAGPEVKVLITRLREELGKKSQITVVDAGSLDGSVLDFPEDEVTRLIQSERGRGNQIAAGIAQTKTPWVLVVHADSLPPAGWYGHLMCALDEHDDVAMWVFGQRFDRYGLGILCIEALNELRVVFGAVAFGDQIMVLRRSAMEASGGFPIQPLMEDVEVCQRLHEQGRVGYLGREWTVSARRWGGGINSRFWMIIRFVVIYQIVRLRGRDKAARLSENLYRTYYPDLPASKAVDT